MFTLGLVNSTLIYDRDFYDKFLDKMPVGRAPIAHFVLQGWVAFLGAVKVAMLLFSA